VEDLARRRRAPMLAGMAVSPATASTVPSTAAASHQAGGTIVAVVPPPFAATADRLIGMRDRPFGAVPVC
jgi:hypothetical protein